MTTPNNTVAGLAEKLLPCPFCGNDVQDDEGCFPAGRGNPHFIVRCGNPGCNAEVSMPSKADTIAAWNRRALASPAPSVEATPNPLARYWMNRSEFWMQKAIALGWREVRDAANGEAPSVSPAVAGGFSRAWDAVAATLTEVAPGWDTPDGTCDKDRACNAIRRLATPEQPATFDPEHDGDTCRSNDLYAGNSVGWWKSKANARLIAPAPDQHEVLLGVAEWIANHVPECEGREYHLKAALAAIALATGGHR